MDTIRERTIASRARWTACLTLGAAPVIVAACSAPPGDADERSLPGVAERAGRDAEAVQRPALAMADPDVPPIALGLLPEERLELLRERYLERLRERPTELVRGRALQADGAPVAGVDVHVGARVTTTDAEGLFEIEGVPVGHHLVSFEHGGYVFSQRTLRVDPGEPAWIDGYLLPRAGVRRFRVDQGTSIVEGPLTVEIEPGDLVFEEDGGEIEGEIEAEITAIDPRQPGHILASPTALEGVTPDGALVGLVSYGMLEVELFQGARKVQVRPGRSVRAIWNLGDGRGLVAGDEIPMWHHDVGSGLWVQERGVDAEVKEGPDGSRVAVAELPHFSTWNYDGVADATCAMLRVPTNGTIDGLRVASTDASGNYDNLWTLLSQCRKDSVTSYLCTTNVPTRASSNTYFKLQLQIGGQWCDAWIDFLGVERKVLSSDLMNQWLSTWSRSAGSWCGAARGYSTSVTGEHNVGETVATLPDNHIRLGIVAKTDCAGSSGGRYVSGDSGFMSMVSNSLSSTYSGNTDRDGTSDSLDRCGARSGSQTDANGNGYGDACEPWCHVPPGGSSIWYDYDGDGIDDMCDNLWTSYNPSQYKPELPSPTTSSSGSGSGGGSCLIQPCLAEP